MSEGETQKKKTGPIWYWYLVPVFFGIVGGIVGYMVLRNSDRDFARRLLMIGAIMVVVSITLSMFVLGRIFDTVGLSGAVAPAQASIGLVDGTCNRDSGYVIVVRNIGVGLDVPTSALKVDVDGAMFEGVVWSPESIPSGETSVGTISNPSGRSAGSVHRIGVTSGASGTLYVTVSC